MLKKKIGTSIFITIVLALTFVMGMFAASAANVSIGGTVYFEALGKINATISLTHTAQNAVYVNAGQGTAGNGSITFNGSETQATGSFNLSGTQDGTGVSFTAQDGADTATYSYTLTITNNYTINDTIEKRGLKISFAEPNPDNKISVNYSSSTDWYASDDRKYAIIGPNETVSIVVTLAISDVNTSVSTDLASNIQLESVIDDGFVIIFDPMDSGTRQSTLSFSAKTVTTGKRYGELPTVVPNEPAFFKGWYTEMNGKGTQITEDTIVTLTGPHTLYAYW